MEYVIGRKYMSEMGVLVIYRGWSETRKRHLFELKYLPGHIRCEGKRPSNVDEEMNYLYVGRITEYTSSEHGRIPSTQHVGQSKRWSLIETIIGVIIGFIVALLIQLAIFPLFGIATSFGENFTIAGVFTVASVIRGYYVRRMFSWLRHSRGIGL